MLAANSGGNWREISWIWLPEYWVYLLGDDQTAITVKRVTETFNSSSDAVSYGYTYNYMQVCMPFIYKTNNIAQKFPALLSPNQW